MKIMISLILLQAINVILAAIIVYLTTKLLRVKSIMTAGKTVAPVSARKQTKRAAVAFDDYDAWVFEQRKKGNNVTT
jgi:hypothetical protein